MSFEFKKLVVIILFVLLVIVGATSALRLVEVGKQNHEAERARYHVNSDPTGESWEVVSVGEWMYKFDDVFLIRVGNFEKYKLLIHFYDGVTFDYKSAEHLFGFQEAAVRLIPSMNVVYVHDTNRPSNNQTSLEIEATPTTYSISGSRVAGKISPDPIRAFGILTSEKQPMDGANNRLRFVDRETIEKTCREFEMKCVWFTIVER